MQNEELSSRIHYRREGLQIFFVLSGNILFLLQCVQITTQHNKSPLPLVHRDVCTRMQSCGTGTTKSTNLFKCYLNNITRLKSHEDEDIFPMLFFSSSSNSLLYTGISIQTPWQHPAGNLTGVIGAAHGAQLQSIFPLHSLPLQQRNLVHHSAQTYMYYLFILKSIIVKSNPVFALRRWVCWKQWCLLPEPPPAQMEHSSGRRTGGSPWVPPGFRATLLINFALTWFYSSHFSPAPQGNSVKFTKCNS